MTQTIDSDSLSKPLDRFAEFISHLFDPFLIVFPVLLFAGFEEKVHQQNSFYFIFSLSILILFIIPFSYTLLLKHFGIISNFFYSRKKDRLYLFPLVISVIAIMTWLLKKYYPETIIITYLELSFGVLVIIALLTPLTKISLHMVGLSSLMVICLFIWGSQSLFIALALPLVAWSRLHLHQHNPLQVILGTFLGGGLSLVYLLFFNYR